MVIEAGAVLFDYGNTLEMDPFNTILKRHKQDFLDILQRHGYGSLMFPEYWQRANKEMNWKYASHFSQEEPFIQRALEAYNVPAAKRTVLAPKILTAYRRFLTQHRTKYPNKFIVKEVLTSLKEKKKLRGILSNDREWAPRSCMETYGVLDLFNNIFTSESIGLEKPDPKIFEHVCDAMATEPEDMCYVGDDPVRDIQCPKQLGIKTVLFVPPGKYKQSESWRDYNAKISERPDAVITDLRELPKLIV